MATTVLELHQRYGIAVGIAKGLRFLHEECRGGPVIHRDVRPSNILLTHDFVPMVNNYSHPFLSYHIGLSSLNHQARDVKLFQLLRKNVV